MAWVILVSGFISFLTFSRQSLPKSYLAKEFCPTDLNDDVVGRTLDAIYKYGATELFNEISLHIMKQFSFGPQLLHVDTTNFGVYGKYENDALSTPG